MLSLNYDECLHQNPFFEAIQENHSDIIKKATEEDWIICIPRIGTTEPTTISTEDILEHILVPNLDLPNTHFCTLTKREVIIQDKFVAIKGEKQIRILFDETIYIDKSQKYKLWCIERPLHQCLSNHEAYISIRNVHDCIKLLWRRNKGALDNINKVMQKFLADACEFDEFDVLQEKISVLYGNCLEAASISHEIPDDGNINLAIETYMQHCVHHKLFRAVCNCTWQVDANFNKTHRNVSDIQLKDLEIGNEFFESISGAKRELSSINKFSTALGKVECLRRTVNTLSHKNKTQSLCVTVTTDDLLKIFVFLVVKSNLSNWIGNLMYITHFRFSSINLSDENSFLITTLEAAIEYIKSEMIRPKINLDQSLTVINGLSGFFACVKEGNLDAIKKVFDSKTKNVLIIDKTTSSCHPLCSCDKCESVAPFNVNSRDDKGCTALHVACLHGQPHVVEYLVSKGVEVNVFDYSESMPLHYAALKGNQNSLLLLLHSNAQVDPKDCDGNTPLHLAANNGHENCVKALLYFAEQKATFVDVNFGNNMGDAALHFAAKWGYAGIARILLQYGGAVLNSNKRNQKVLDVVHNDYLKKLLSASFAQNNQQSILPNKIQRVTVDLISMRPKNFHQVKKTDLVLKSIENNDLPLMCYYLGIPTPPSTTNSPAKSTCHPLCTCDNCQKQFENPTIPSSKYSDSETLETLNINTCNSEGHSALHVAAKCGRTEILRLLLDSGALVNVKTYKYQQTPLHLACKYQRIQIVRELLQCGGCDLDVQDAKGNSALHYACLSNNTRIVELLLSHGSNFNVKNGEGKSPLQEAKGRMLYNIVTLLQGKGESSDSSESVCDLFSF